MLSPEELIRRARVRCKHHRQPRVGGVCRECLVAEIEEAIAEEHPELKRGDVFELVQEWLRTTDHLVHRITEPDDLLQATAYSTNQAISVYGYAELTPCSIVTHLPRSDI